MSEKSAIEWTDTTWNCLTGCTPVSPGCTNCYAALLSATRLKDTPRYKGLAVVNSRGQGVFNGTVRMHEDKLLDPLKWRTPRRVFVNSMSDVFHEAVPFEFIDKMFAVMALCPQHTFQVLTKRPERMAEYLKWSGHDPQSDGGRVPCSCRQCSIVRHMVPLVQGADVSEGEAVFGCAHYVWKNWPLPNVWLGTSVEDQERADLRVPHLLRCPAAVRFLSCEPLLGLTDLDLFARWCLRDDQDCDGDCEDKRDHLHWVIVGGESGPNARPMHPEWARSLRDQCVAAQVPHFFKQWGGRTAKTNGRELDGREWNEYPLSMSEGPAAKLETGHGSLEV